MSFGNSPAPKAPRIRFLLIPVLGDIIEHMGMVWKAEATNIALRRMIGEFFDEPFERVNVLYRGEYRDMFVGETSSINGRHIRNIRATEIYRNNSLKNGWYHDLEALASISGPAVLFPDYQVWK